MYAYYPYERTIVHYHPKYSHEVVTDFLPREIEMINPRFGRICLEKDKKHPLYAVGVNTGKRKTYRQMEIDSIKLNDAYRDYERRMQNTDPEFKFEITPQNMWETCEPVFYSRDTDREEVLYDVIDIATGWVLCRTFKHDAKKMIDTFFTGQFQYKGEDITEVEKWRGNKRYTEKQTCGIYTYDKQKIVARVKLDVKESK